MLKQIGIRKMRKWGRSWRETQSTQSSINILNNRTAQTSQTVQISKICPLCRIKGNRIFQDSKEWAQQSWNQHNHHKDFNKTINLILFHSKTKTWWISTRCNKIKFSWIQSKWKKLKWWHYRRWGSLRGTDSMQMTRIELASFKTC